MKRLVALSLLWACTGCLGTSPEAEARDSLGDADDGDPEHRPGQPCLVCHGEDYSPGDAVFAVAGTVYLRKTDPLGLEGASVTVQDDRGHAFTALTNRAGNFMVSVRDGISGPEQHDRGELDIPWEPAYPLSISVSYGDAVQEMRSVSHREGSCAACHGLVAGAASVGRVFVIDDEVMP